MLVNFKKPSLTEPNKSVESSLGQFCFVLFCVFFFSFEQDGISLGELVESKNWQEYFDLLRAWKFELFKASVALVVAKKGLNSRNEAVVLCEWYREHEGRDNVPVVLHMDTAEKKFESISGLLPSRRLAFLRELPKKRQICKFSWPQPQSLAENRRKVPRNGRFIFKKEKRSEIRNKARLIL